MGVVARRIENIGEGLFKVGNEVVDRAIGRMPKMANYGTVQTSRGKYVARCRYCCKAGHQTEDCRERIETEGKP